MKWKGVATVIMLVSLLFSYLIAAKVYAIPSFVAHPHNAATVHWESCGVPGHDDDCCHNHRDAEDFDNDPIYDALMVWDDERLRLDRVDAFDRGHGFINEWGFLGGGADPIPEYWFDPADPWHAQARPLIRTAFRLYDSIGSDQVNHRVGIAFRETDIEADAEIRIHWHDLGAGGPLGTTEPAPGEPFWDRPNVAPVTITFNSAKNWHYGQQGTTPANRYHFFSTVLHEIGHAVGLDEQDDTVDVMIRERRRGPNNPPQQGPAFDGLDPDTIHGVRDLYMIEPPPPPIPPAPAGPRSDLWFFFYNRTLAAYSALTAGEIDIMAWPLNHDQFLHASSNPDILLARYQGLDMFLFELNNNDTIRMYPDVLSPMTSLYFRRALAHLVDKDCIVNFIMEGFADRIDVPIPALLGSWWNLSVTGVNYPYPYHQAIASAILDAAGFKDTDSDNVRNYPLGWPGRETGPNLDPIVFYARADLPELYLAAEMLRYEMLATGIPVDFRAASLDVIHYQAIVLRDYHISTGSWLLDRWPLHLYQLYHSTFWYLRELNYVVPPGKYPELDEALERFWYAPTLDEARLWAMNVQSIFVENVISIPLWSTKSFYAYRNLCGVVNALGYGIMNDYTFMNAYRIDDPSRPIRVGLVNVPLHTWTLGTEFLPGGFLGISPIFWKSSIWSFDWSAKYILDRITEKLIMPQPDNLTIDQPWLAQDWDSGTWVDPETGETKQKITFWLRGDAGINTGDVPLNLLPYDVHHIEDVSEHIIKIYLNIPDSIWALYWIGEMPLLYYSAISMYIPQKYVPGGYLLLEANENFFLETPPLGEIDWRWIWVEGPKPRTGYFKIDICDVVKACVAYGSSGRGVPSYNWLPGADLVVSGDGKPGKIDISDVVIICGKFGLKFGQSPP